MTTFKQFIITKLHTEARDILPIGTISHQEAEKKIPKKLNQDTINQYLKQGFAYVYRTEGFSMFLAPLNRGIYYFFGDENDTKLNLGNCLIANNKVHAAHLLGFNKKFILKKLNYYVDTPKNERSPEKENQLINSFLSGNKSLGFYDQFDHYITSAAKHQGYDTIILSNEPTRRGKGSELIDLRSEVIPQSVETLQQED